MIWINIRTVATEIYLTVSDIPQMSGSVFFPHKLETVFGKIYLTGQAVNALKSEIATMVTDKLITASVKDFAQDKDYLNAFIVALASKWSVDEPIVISTADAESLKKYFAAHAKALLDKGVKIEQVNGIKTLFTVSPADGSYKVNFGEEEFMNYFKAFLRPQLVEMLF